MKKIHISTFYFCNLTHFIVVQLTNGDYRYFKTAGIMSLSATKRIVRRLKEARI